MLTLNCRLDDFKDSVARQTSIPAQQLVALTSAGKNVKYQMLYQEVCCYSPLTVAFG